MAKTYSELLTDPRWQKKRLEILERDNWCCQLCGDAETTLHVHHKEYKRGKKPWEYYDNVFITLCKHCHRITESELKLGRTLKEIKVARWTSPVFFMAFSLEVDSGQKTLAIYDLIDDTLKGIIAFSEKDILVIGKKLKSL